MAFGSTRLSVLFIRKDPNQSYEEEKRKLIMTELDK
jgi:hypothetical protein